ncbi:MAG TPA: hypothetical protein VM008_05460 [Phycisphaerae bacterium]|nr:hypothetical protein [Phycisphaerae bacterium]
MIPAWLLAYADPADQSDALLVLALESFAVVAAAALVAIVPIMICNARRHPRPDYLFGVCILWALVTVGDLLYLLFARYQWANEYRKLVMSGYYDPANTADAPRPHWMLWLLLGLVYAGLLISAARGQRNAARTSVVSTPHESNGHSPHG